MRVGDNEIDIFEEVLAILQTAVARMTLAGEYPEPYVHRIAYGLADVDARLGRLRLQRAGGG
jgi:hypothetical protein